MKEIANSNSDSPVEKPVSEILDKFLAKKEIVTAMDFKKMFKIPDRRFNIIRIKNLILQKDYEKLESLLNEINRKTPVLPWEFVAEMLFEVGNPELAEKYLGKVADLEEQVINEIQNFLYLKYFFNLGKLLENIRKTKKSSGGM